MLKRIPLSLLLIVGAVASALPQDYLNSEYGRLLDGSTSQVALWWASSGWKIGRDKPLPTQTDKSILIRAARNEAEAAQLIVQPKSSLKGLTLRATALKGPAGAVLPAERMGREVPGGKNRTA